MNRQYRDENHRGIEWTDYTWNRLGGCAHDCEWIMPDGELAVCYAKEVAEGVARAAYPEGFKHLYFHPERDKELDRLKQPSRIFIDSMSDLLAAQVPMEFILDTLATIRHYPQHSFQLLTKNAPRLMTLAATNRLPSNLWVGVSMPPSRMFGKPLTPQQQGAYISRALDMLAIVGQYTHCIRWMSFEPLSFDVSANLTRWIDKPWRGYPDNRLPLDWAVIGAASKGKTKYQPDPVHVRKLRALLDAQSTPIFYKGNLRGNAGIDTWLEEFPAPRKGSS